MYWMSFRCGLKRWDGYITQLVYKVSGLFQVHDCYILLRCLCRWKASKQKRCTTNMVHCCNAENVVNMICCNHVFFKDNKNRKWLSERKLKHQHKRQVTSSDVSECITNQLYMENVNQLKRGYVGNPNKTRHESLSEVAKNCMRTRGVFSSKESKSS